MEYRNLGSAGVKVSPLWLGTAYFNTRISEEAAAWLIHAALEAGINVIDTANAYSEPRGYAEEIVGRAIKSRRDKVVLATKVFHPMGDGPNDRGSSRYHIMEQVHASLRRLNTERIDLYQLHRPDPEVPIEETLRTLEDLRRQGKILYFGTSKFAGWQLCEALWTSDRLGLAPIVSEQPEYSLVDRSIEAEVLPVTRKYGLGVVPFSPLGGGWLTGKYRRGDTAPADSRFAGRGMDFAGDTYAPTFDALENLEALAAGKNITLSQLALAWLLAQPGITAPIIGPRTLQQLQDNLGALEVTLTAGELAAVDDIVPPMSVLPG
ncbi:MAG: aldo/keto reductase [Chloroflexi bacterium]|nr:aldo/keto reductase [Chloroflexota bacterium]